MTVADRIKEERIKRGWTQEEMASRCGYKWKTAISKIESSGDEISSKKIKLVASVLDVPVSYLMGWQDEPVNETQEYLTELRDRPEMKVLFDSAKTATAEQLERITKYLEFLKQGN